MISKYLLLITALVVASCTTQRPLETKQQLILAHTDSNSDHVSVRTVHFTAQDGAIIEARLWHQTRDNKLSLFGQSRIRPGYQAVADGDFIHSKPEPLVLILHGSGGSAESMAWLAVSLVQRGAIVVGADHPASANGNPERRSILNLWAQPRDVRLIVDQLKTSQWASKIDHDRISVVGFSLGGASSMMLAGARLEFEKFPIFCEHHDDGACRAFRQHFTSMDKQFFTMTNKDYSESRLKTAIAIAPGFTETMTSASIRNMNIPTLIITGADDQQLPPKTHMAPILEFIKAPNHYKEIIGAQHFSFLPLCGPEAQSILAETNEEFVCEEVGEKTRSQIHSEAIYEIAHFLCERGLLDHCDNKFIGR